MIKALVRFFNADGLLKDSSVLFVGMAIAQVINLLFQMYMGRRLLPGEFALLVSLLGLLNVLTFPLGVFSSAITRYSSLLIKSDRAGDIPRLLFFWGKRLVVVGLVFSLLCFSAPGPIALFLHLDRVAPVYIFGFILTGLFCRPVVNGALLGLQRFDIWCWGTVIGALVRLIVGAYLVAAISPFAGWGLLGHGLGFYATFFFAAAFLVVALKGAATTGEPLPAMNHYLAGSFVIMFGYSILMTGDVILVKHLMPDVAGDFAFAATLGHLVLFAPQSLVGAMFPKVVADGNETSKQRMLLLKTLLASFIFAVASAVVFSVFARILPRLLFEIPEPSDELVRWLRQVSWAMVPVALLSSIMRYALAQHRLAAGSMIPLSTIGFIGCAFGWAETPDGLLGLLSLFSSVALLLTGGLLLWKPKGAVVVE
ncbi:hypothetical protein P4E94_12935 [Pontiellaceae bacterium B12219]|nr:hypothetical protein [Pontiellaceae bacterium B12219]